MPPTQDIIHPKSDAVKYFFARPVLKPFELQPSVNENVVELRRALGSVKRPLSREDLAHLLNERDPARARGYSTVERWETKGVEPDLESIRIMAQMAGVSFEEFALGRRDAVPASPRRPAMPAPAPIPAPRGGSAQRQERKRGA